MSGPNSHVRDLVDMVLLTRGGLDLARLASAIRHLQVAPILFFWKRSQR